jgi:hypothetical protein
MPDFSVLPAPLTLYILLELPDLKALYAAILASPHVNAVFRLNSRHIFKEIVARTLPRSLSPRYYFICCCESVWSRNPKI